MKISKALQKIKDVMSCIVLMTFTLACYWIYLCSINNTIALIFIIATVLWFYSFLVDLGHLFGLLED